MIEKHKTVLLTSVGIVDLACFVLGGLHYGEYWSIAGVVGLGVWLLLLELTQ